MSTDLCEERQPLVANNQRPPRFLKQRSSRWLILITICMAVFTDAFLYGVVVPILPFSLSDRSGIPEEDLQFWNSMLLSVFGAAQLIGSPFVGWFADRSTSRRIPLLTGLVVNAIATAMFGMARNVYILATSRFLQGLAASVVWTVGFALLADTVGNDEIGHWVGYLLTSVNVGILVAPLVGGILYDWLGYLSVFVSMLILIIIDIALRLTMIEKKRARKWLQVPSDPPHVESYGTIGHQTRIMNTQVRAEDSCNSPQPIVEPQGLNKKDELISHPLPIITLLQSPRILAALYGKWVEATIVIGFDSALPIFVSEVFGWDAAGAGLVFLTITIPSISAPLVGMLSDRFGPRWVSIIGFVMGAVSTTLLQFVKENKISDIIIMCILLTIDGFAFVFMISPLAADLTTAVICIERDRPGIFGKSGAYAQVYALFTCAIGLGVLAGPIWVSLAYEPFGWKGTVLGFGILSLTPLPGLILYGGERYRPITEGS
ncbi:hypothetical protein BGAL_0164g00050 [Botrytis galanthina]|uniref:Major facilitator superfamily (MFS) profile domain-containing protein n=1 Tax=Botrytis galanthina TaxID=278940 RepID=A0A4S8R9W4_9HELO|nr:hypothetical protein BGAL_0164g00050 [Botrytis galanthina]